MFFSNIPNITPTISVPLGRTIPLLLSSIALEELSLAHIINAEAEKVQLVLGTLTPTRTTFSPATVSLSNLLAINESVHRTLRDVIKNEMLLEFKFENLLELIPFAEPVLLSSQTFTGPDVQTITVPFGVSFVRIRAVGANGGAGITGTPGNGASIQGDFPVTFGETLTVLAGGVGVNGLVAGGGGGGSFVWRGTGFPALSATSLLVAAGGGGGGAIANGVDATIPPPITGSPGTTGNPAGGGGGINGGGGGGGSDIISGGGGGGAGVFGSGGNGGNGIIGTGGLGGQEIDMGGNGGTAGTFGGNGGFGGGGGGGANGGGGGGYNGGGGGSRVIAINSGGGGGGSINNGTNQVNNANAGTGNGTVTIDFFGI